LFPVAVAQLFSLGALIADAVIAPHKFETSNVCIISSEYHAALDAPALIGVGAFVGFVVSFSFHGFVFVMLRSVFVRVLLPPLLSGLRRSCPLFRIPPFQIRRICLSIDS
jgi:hypothetical protein